MSKEDGAQGNRPRAEEVPLLSLLGSSWSHLLAMDSGGGCGYKCIQRPLVLTPRGEAKTFLSVATLKNPMLWATNCPEPAAVARAVGVPSTNVARG